MTEEKKASLLETAKNGAQTLFGLIRKNKEKIAGTKQFKFFGDNSFLVVFYGIFVVLCAVIQCASPLIALLSDRVGYEGVFSNLFNSNLRLPMAIITWFWASLCAIYVGADRAAFAIASREGSYNNPELGHPERLKVIVWESFWVFVISLLLNMIFDVDLQLEPLASAFGGALLCFVAGNKAIKACTALAEEDDLDGNGVSDSTEDPVAVIERLKAILVKDGMVSNESDIDGDGIDDKEQDPKEIIERLKKVVEMRKKK